MTLSETKIRFTAAELVAIDAAATAAGRSRSAYVRGRVTDCNSIALQLTPATYHRLVADTCTFMRGNLSRNHIETLTAYVIRRLDQYQREAAAGDQSAA